MTTFAATLKAWDTDAFVQQLKDDILHLGGGVLPLHDGVTRGGYVDDSDLELTLLSARDDGDAINARLGVFFTEIVINCGCGDDPMEEHVYCEMSVRIDKGSAKAEFAVTPV